MNRQRFRPWLGLPMLLGVTAWAAAPVHAQTTQPTTAPSATRPADFEAHEWAVFVFDGLSDKLNAEGLVTTPLPAFVPTHRHAADGPASAIGPIGVVRFTGHAPDKIDVNLSRGGGRFMASWPRAEERTSGLLWRNLTLQDQPGGDGLTKTEPDTAVGRLRGTNGPFVIDGKGGCEPFLLFDVELPFTCPVKVEASAAGVRATNAGSIAVHGLTLFRHAGGGWANESVGDLPPAPQPSAGPATRPSSTRPTTPATKRPGTAAALAVAPDSDPRGLAADWVRGRLGDAELSDGDRSLIADLITRYGFDGGRLTAVYRLDDADMDGLMPIEVLPQPHRLTRVGIVLLRNIDPSAGTDVDDLIGQLGDPSWPTREAASKALATIGSAATSKLKAATKSPDPEVAWRAERLLARGPNSVGP